MLTKLQFRPGINRETTDYTNSGGWYDGDSVMIVPHDYRNKDYQHILSLIESGEVIVEPFVTPPLTRYELEVARKAAYVNEADPIFFLMQRGEATIEEWHTKIEEIKLRYPYPN